MSRGHTCRGALRTELRRLNTDAPDREEFAARSAALKELIDWCLRSPDGQQDVMTYAAASVTWREIRREIKTASRKLR